jgi:hypothetical protein
MIMHFPQLRRRDVNEGENGWSTVKPILFTHCENHCVPPSHGLTKPSRRKNCIGGAVWRVTELMPETAKFAPELGAKFVEQGRPESPD